MKEKIMWTMNVALMLGVVFFSLHLLDVNLPTLGKAQYWLDDSEPVCIASFEGKNSPIDMNLCCYGLQMQLGCDNQRGTIMIDGEKWTVDKKCSTGPGAISYLVNTKAFNQCKFN
ncbi:hypothetical protein GOV03_02915 [Candidatus Woesearchaeota archaeon]|nr:hypothetical protein [Candidatus Woesearchaeota archaeon]